MSPEAVFGVLITCILGQAGLWVKHILDCRDRDRRAAESQEKITVALEAIRVHVANLAHESERLARNGHDTREHLRRVGMLATLAAEKLGLDHE